MEQTKQHRTILSEQNEEDEGILDVTAGREISRGVLGELIKMLSPEIPAELGGAPELQHIRRTLNSEGHEFIDNSSFVRRYPWTLIITNSFKIFESVPILVFKKLKGILPNRTAIFLGSGQTAEIVIHFLLRFLTQLQEKVNLLLLL